MNKTRVSPARRRPRGRAAAALLLVALACVALAALLAGCGSGGSQVLVTIEGNQYNPDSVTVSVGTTVKWVNRDATAHTVMSDELDNTPPKTLGPNQMASGPMDPGTTYQVTFTAPGTYKYHCMIHGYMHGVVIVQ